MYASPARRLSQIPGDHASDKPGVADIAPAEPPGFEPEPERPFQASVPHPARGAADSSGGEVEGCSDLNANRHSEFL